MRKYFTKYLPVEGEVQEGGKFLHTNTGLIETAIHVHGPHTHPHKPVKLFLCTSEIKVGDRILNNEGEEVTVAYVGKDQLNYDVVGWVQDKHVYLKEKQSFSDWLNPLLISAKSTHRTCLRHQASKVLGEVSTNAIWVTDRMEFDEDEVEEWYWHLKQNCFAIPVCFAEEVSNKSPNFHPNTWETNKEAFKRGIFKILCPTCKTFH